METREPSREAVVVRSKRLGQMLKKDFDAKWEKGIHFKKYYEMCTKDFVRRRQIPCVLEKKIMEWTNKLFNKNNDAEHFTSDLGIKVRKTIHALATLRFNLSRITLEQAKKNK